MLKRESLYLDLIRALAAVIVVVDHAPSAFNLSGTPRWGHQAVIVFYVLSGYLIAATAEKPGASLRSFMAARLARLWSVLLPALLLTVICDVAGRLFGSNPAAYADVPANLPALRLGAAVLFLSESWVSIQPLSDGVIWSLCSEFWYYAMFAAWVFIPPGRTRTVTLVGLGIVSGFKAILLLPIWLMGVALHRSTALRRLPDFLNVLIFGLCTFLAAAILATQFYDVPIRIMQAIVDPWVYRQLAQARVFWFDWAFGVLVFGHLLGARTVMQVIPIERFKTPIAWCAGVSFAAYLFHAPLERVFAAFLPGLNGWVGIAMTLVVIGILGPPAEQSRRWWARRIDAVSRQSSASGLAMIGALGPK